MQSNSMDPLKSYKRISNELEMASILLDEGSLSLDEYETIVLKLHKEFKEIEKGRAFRFNS